MEQNARFLRLRCWTCTILMFAAFAAACLIHSSRADADDCPALKECSLLERAYQGCSKNKADDCVRFVRHYASLSSTQCHKKSDLDASEQKVAAVQSCDAHKDFTLAQYTEMLANLNTPDAQKFFSSEKFRKAVSKTAVGEEYIDRSKDLERELADKSKPKSKVAKKDDEGGNEAPVESDSGATLKKPRTDLGKPDDPIKEK